MKPTSLGYSERWRLLFALALINQCIGAILAIIAVRLNSDDPNGDALGIFSLVASFVLALLCFRYLIPLQRRWFGMFKVAGLIAIGSVPWASTFVLYAIWPRAKAPFYETLAFLVPLFAVLIVVAIFVLTLIALLLMIAKKPLGQWILAIVGAFLNVVLQVALVDNPGTACLLGMLGPWPC